LQIGFAGIVLLLILIGLRVPIGLALMLVAVGGIGVLKGWDVAGGMLRTEPYDFGAHWSFSAIPMFLLMSAIAYHTGISATLFSAARVWVGRFPGGLAISANFACAGFAAVSGSSIATAAAMGRLTIPEMLKAKYHPGLATGVVASAGTLGSMIPPSIAFVLYGIFAEVSIAKLFMAGILPGILTAVIYAIMIVARCAIWPDLGPPDAQRYRWRDRLRALHEIWPVVVLILSIIGGLYGGLVTPTEAGAFGAFMACLVAAMKRTLTWANLKAAVIESVTGTAKIFWIATGAVLFTRFLAMTGAADFIKTTMGDWGADPILLLVATSIIYFILGCFLDPLGLMLLTLPLLLPMFEGLNLNLIWFGVLVVKYIEIGLLTPPVGLNVYMVKSLVGDTIPLETIFKGVGWFLACEAVVLFLLISFPEISLFLPSQMD